MKKILKNNSIIITALCIMIAIVWYLNYTDGEKVQEASNPNYSVGAEDEDTLDYNKVLTENGLEWNDLLELDNENQLAAEKTDLETAEGYKDMELAEGDELMDISDEDIAALEEVAEGDTEETESLTAGDGLIVTDNGEIVGEDETNTSAPGEAVLASTTISSTYFASAKLTREQNRAREKESLLEMMESESISDEVKQKAVDTYLAVTANMEKENSTELLLEAKGFEGAIVSIIDDSVEVIINAPTITEQQIAQIESIVRRKAEVEAENIVISPVVVEE